MTKLKVKSEAKGKDHSQFVIRNWDAKLKVKSEAKNEYRPKFVMRN